MPYSTFRIVHISCLFRDYTDVGMKDGLSGGLIHIESDIKSFWFKSVYYNPDPLLLVLLKDQNKLKYSF